jgi:hypothetical protein
MEKLRPIIYDHNSNIDEPKKKELKAEFARQKLALKDLREALGLPNNNNLFWKKRPR